MNDDLHLLTGAYAVDALTADEGHRFERHLAACADCQAEVAGFHETTAQLADAFAVAEPPASLRTAVLSEVERTRQVTKLSTPRRVRSSTPTWLALAAGVAVVAGLGGLLVRSQGRIDDLERTEQLALAADAETVNLEGAGDAIMRFTWSPELGAGLFVAGDMATAGADADYQLWIVANGTPRSLGVFDPSDGSVELTTDDVPAPGDVVAVTIEPDGGSPEPTSDPIRAATIA